MKGRRQVSVNSRTSKRKGKAKAVTPPTSEEEPDDNDDKGMSDEDGDIPDSIQPVSREVTHRKAKPLSQGGKVAGVILKVSDDELASDSDSITGKLTCGIQAPVKPKASRGKEKGKPVALPTSEEELVSQDNLELLTNDQDRFSRGNRQPRAVTLQTSEKELDDLDALHLMACDGNQSRLVKEVAQKVKGGQTRK